MPEFKNPCDPESNIYAGYDEYYYLCEGKFINPDGIAVDNNGYIYVNDSGTIYKLTSSGSIITKWNCQGRMAVDSMNNIYCLNTEENRVLKYTPTGSLYLPSTNWVSYDSGICIDKDDYLYLISFNIFGDGFIEKLTTSFVSVTNWNISGEYSSFNSPDVVVDNSGYIYISANDKIIKLNQSGDIIQEWGAHGTANGQFYQLQGITIDKNNYIYTVEYDAMASGSHFRIQKFSSVGVFIKSWGNYIDNYARDLAVDQNGYIYVGSSDKKSIVKFK